MLQPTRSSRAHRRSSRQLATKQTQKGLEKISGQPLGHGQGRAPLSCRNRSRPSLNGATMLTMFHLHFKVKGCGSSLGIKKDITKLVLVTSGLSILYSRRGSLQGPLSFYRVAGWNRRKKSLSGRDWHISRSASRQICILKYVKVVL